MALNKNSAPSVNSWLKVRPTSASGSPAAIGSVVTVQCVEYCVTPWTASRVVSPFDATFGFPSLKGKYNITVVSPSGTSSWQTHPALGLFAPTLHGGLIVVRPTPVTIDVRVTPYEYAILQRMPDVGSIVVVELWVSDGAATDLALAPGSSAIVSGQDVSGTFERALPGVYRLAYSVFDVAWPWTGLSVAVSVVDSAGLVTTVQQPAVIAGSTYNLQLPTTPASASGACVADVDGNGTPDVFLAMRAESDILFLNSGDFVFTDAAADYGVASLLASTGCQFVDVDGSCL